MKFIYVLLILLFASPANAGLKAVATPTLGNLPGKIGVSQGGTGSNTSSGASCSATDNATAVNAAVNGYVTTMTANGTTLGFAPFYFPACTYYFLNTVTTRPWIKFDAIGGVTFDFTGLSTSGTAFRSHNQDAPSGNGSSGNSNIANQGSWLNGEQGAIYIKGSGEYTNATTLSGNITSTATSVPVTSAASLTAGNLLLIDNEAMTISSISSNTLTVVRNTNGSVAASHSSGATVNLINTSIALDMGDVQGTASNNGATDYRDVSLSKTGISDFGTGLYLRLTNNYFNRFDQGGYSFRNAFGLVTENYSGNNSGELDSFKNWIFSGGINGILFQGAGTDFEIENTSIDYTFGSAIYLTGNANYMTVSLNNAHVEHCEGGIAYSDISTNNQMRFNVRNLVFNGTSALTRGSSPKQAFIRGKMYLDLDSIVVGYAQYWQGADNAMFMVDNNASIVNFKNIAFTAFGYYQLTSQQQLLNNDPFFAQGTSGNDLIANPMPTWHVTASNGISAAVDNTTYWTSIGTATQSIAFTYTGASNYYVIESDRFAVKPGQRLIADVAVYGGTSTGGDQVQLNYVFTSSTDASLPAISTTAVGANTNTLYTDTGYPGYTGTRTWWAKPTFIPINTVPTGYDQASLVITVSGLASGDVFRVGFAGVNALN